MVQMMINKVSQVSRNLQIVKGLGEVQSSSVKLMESIFSGLKMNIIF